MKKDNLYRLVVIAFMAASFFILPLGGGAQEMRFAVVAELRGPVEVRLGGGAWQAAEEGMVLHEKDEILTAEGGFAELLIDKKGKTGKLTIEGNTRLRLATMSGNPDSIDKTTLLELAIGKVLVRVKKLQGNSKFEVKTPTSTTGVRGTVFRVTVLNR